MINVQEARKLAEKEMINYRLASCKDIGKAYAFSFTGNKGEIIPGLPVICVNKTTSEIDYLTIPPIENLDLLNNGKSIEL